MKRRTKCFLNESSFSATESQVGVEKFLTYCRKQIFRGSIRYCHPGRKGADTGSFPKAQHGGPRTKALPSSILHCDMWKASPRKVFFHPYSICQNLTSRFRFYPTSSNFADKNGNTRPGTVVDKGIVFYPYPICLKFNSIKA
jgi:hypothetical protein